MLSFDSTVQRNDDVMSAEAGEDIVMVSIANGLYYGVSNVAREIWEAIERPKRVCDLIDELSKIYEVDRATSEEQTLSFLQDLLAERLLQVRDGSA